MSVYLDSGTQQRSPRSSMKKASPKVARKSSLCEDTPGSSKITPRKKFWSDEDGIGELARHCRAGRKTLWEKLPGYSVQVGMI